MVDLHFSTLGANRNDFAKMGVLGSVTPKIEPLCPGDPFHSVVTKIDMIGDMDEVIKRTKFGADHLIGVDSAGW